MEIKNDLSYKIKEYIINSEWDNNMSTEYFKYREDWDKACSSILLEKPLFLEVESTYNCNYRCPKCPRVSSDNFNNSGKMSNELFDILFKQIKEFKIPSLAFSHGGEPLTRKDLPELILLGKEAGLVDIMFHTNGYLLTKDISEKIIRNGLTKINISIDAATEETYNKVRVGGNFEKVKKNIFDFLEVRNKLNQTHPRVRVSFVVQECNKNEMEQFYEFWSPYADVISFQDCIDFDKNISAEKIKLINRNENEINYRCNQLWQLLTIANNGDVLLCERDYNHDYVLGNIRTHSLIDCWNSKTINSFRNYFIKKEYDKIPFCYDCIF